MSIAEKLTTIAENVNKVYEAGKAAGGGSGGSPFFYAEKLDNIFIGANFSENPDIVIKVKKAPASAIQCFYNASYYRSVKWIGEDNTNVISFSSSHRVTSSAPCLEVVDFTEYSTKFSDLREMFRGQKKLKSILGTLDLSNCTSTTNFVRECSALENIEFIPKTIKVSISFEYSSLLTAESIQSIIDGLADLTDSDTQTLTLHATVGDKLTDTQKATITAKNWTLAY